MKRDKSRAQSDVAEPKKKQTRAGRGHRYLKAKKYRLQLTLCPKCKTPKPSHSVCPVCGFYKGKVLIEPAIKNTKVKRK